jgi:hypothetical protein
VIRALIERLIAWTWRRQVTFFLIVFAAVVVMTTCGL